MGSYQASNQIPTAPCRYALENRALFSALSDRERVALTPVDNHGNSYWLTFHRTDSIGRMETSPLLRNQLRELAGPHLS
jgi:hypothetical protein